MLNKIVVVWLICRVPVRTCLADSMCCEEDGLLLLVTLGGTERCRNRVQGCFILFTHNRARVTGSRARSDVCQEILQGVVVGPIGEVKDVGIVADRDWDLKLPALCIGRVIRLAQADGGVITGRRSHGETTQSGYADNEESSWECHLGQRLDAGMCEEMDEKA